MSSLFRRCAGLSAIAAAAAVFLYALAFLVISRGNPTAGAQLAALFLFLTGLFAVSPLVAIYLRVRDADTGYALVAFVLAFAGAIGTLLHGGYDLANSINPPTANPASLVGLPSQVDPRGLLTFGLSGLGLFMVSWLITSRETTFPKGLGYVGYLTATLSILLYVGRLVVLNPTSPAIAWPAILNGFIVSPLWYLWLGVALWRGR